MTQPNRRNGSGLDAQTVTLLAILVTVVIAFGSVWAAVTWGSPLDGVNPGLTRDPFELFFGVLRGRITWPASATWILATTLAVVVVAGALACVLWVRRARRRRDVDTAAPHMGRGRDLAALSTKGAKATSLRLGVEGWLGVPIGVTVAGRRPLYGSAEDMHVDIWGPRTGKTTSRAIPAILSAPGAVLTTSNKRDVLDATRDIRAERGRVWAFDPQRIALEEPGWWWNPLSYVTDDVKAAKLAEHFASGTRTLWDTQNPQPVRVNETGTTTHRWFEDPQSSLGTAGLEVSSAGVPTWLLPDFQGSITGTIKTAGLTGTAKYGAFGEELTTTGAMASQPLQFHGQYKDAATGLYDMRMRDYNPTTGGFTNTDPVAAKSGTPFANTYHYAYNQPTTLTDPPARAPGASSSLPSESSHYTKVLKKRSAVETRPWE